MGPGIRETTVWAPVYRGGGLGDSEEEETMIAATIDHHCTLLARDTAIMIQAVKSRQSFAHWVHNGDETQLNMLDEATYIKPTVIQDNPTPSQP